MKKLLKWCAVAVVVYLVFWSGLFIPRHKAFGWTWYILSLGRYKVSTLSAKSAGGNSEHAHACRGNLRRIQDAKLKAGQDRGNPIGSVSWEETIRAMYPDQRLTPVMIQQLTPQCPAGGAYTLGSLEELPRCSVLGNNSVDEADDHIIRY